MRSCHPQLRSELLPLLPYHCSPNGPTTQCRIPFFICTHKYNAENIPPLSQASAFPLILPSLFMSCIDRTWKATSPIRIYRKSVLSLIGLGMGMIGILHRMQDLVCGECGIFAVFLFSFAISALFLPLAVIENRYALFTNKHLRAGRGSRSGATQHRRAFPLLPLPVSFSLVLPWLRPATWTSTAGTWAPSI